MNKSQYNKRYGYTNPQNSLSSQTTTNTNNSLNRYSNRYSNTSLHSFNSLNSINSTNSEQDRLIHNNKNSPIRSSSSTTTTSTSTSTTTNLTSPRSPNIQTNIHINGHLENNSIHIIHSNSQSHSQSQIEPQPTPIHIPEIEPIPVIQRVNSESRPVPLAKPIEVETNLQIFRVHKIDSSSEEFTIDCGITFMWKDPMLIDDANGHHYASHPAVVRHNPRTGRSDYQKWPDHLIVGETVFDPAWKILNCSDVEIIKCFTQILNAAEGLVHNYLHIRATIYQTLDLHNFPFDHQDMTIRIQSEHSDRVLKFVPMRDRKPRLFDNNIASEWNIDCDSIKLIFEMDNKPAASGVSYAAMQCTFHAARRSEWYHYNVFTITYVIVLSSFSIFFVASENVAERLSILFTTWLMLISLKFIISDRLPKISYLTRLDRYLHISYFVMILLISNVCFAQMKWKLTMPSTEIKTEGEVESSILLKSFRESFPIWFLELITYDYEGYLAIILFVGWTGIHLSMLNWFSLSFFKSLFGK